MCLEILGTLRSIDAQLATTTALKKLGVCVLSVFYIVILFLPTYFVKCRRTFLKSK